MTNPENIAIYAGYSDLTEEELLSEACARDKNAFGEIINRNADRFYRFAFSLVKNREDAEDILQETFMGAYKSRKKFERRSSVKTWLFRILFKQVAKSLRKNRKNKSFAFYDDVEIYSPDIERSLDVSMALQQLLPHHLEVVLLKEFEGYSYEEIAEDLGISKGTVASRLYRARDDLKKSLADYLPPSKT